MTTTNFLVSRRRLLQNPQRSRRSRFQFRAISISILSISNIRDRIGRFLLVFIWMEGAEAGRCRNGKTHARRMETSCERVS